MTATDKPNLIYLHVPKTGGSTLNHLISWNYNHIYRIQYYRQIPPFIALPDDEKRQYDCISGQVFFGIHKAVPQPMTYMTLLRQPAKRLISTYFYTMARRKREGLPNPDATFEEFIQQEPYQADMQLRMVLGGGSMDETLNAPLAPDAVERAKRNVEEHFAVAGVMDYYDESLIMMKRSLGWSRAYYARRNVNEKRPRGENVPANMQQLAEELTKTEFEFFEWLKTRQEEQLTQMGNDFREEVAALRRANQRFQFWYQLAEPIRGTPLWNAVRETGKRLSRLR